MTSLAASCGDPSLTNSSSGGSVTTISDGLAFDLESDGSASSFPAPAQVSTADPYPPQADSEADPVAAEAAVRYAFEHWILIDLDPDLRAKLVENGELNRDQIHQGLQQARSIADKARFVIDAVRFTSATEADVNYRLSWDGGPSPYFPDPMTGRALFADGSWRVRGDVLCTLAFGSGVECAGVQARKPEVPKRLLLLVPEGYRAVGEGNEGSVSVPGFGEWITTGGDRLTITTHRAVGASELDAESVSGILRSGSYGVTDGDTVEVGERPGVLLVAEGRTTLAFVRADDVIVVITATTLPAERLRVLGLSLAADFAIQSTDVTITVGRPLRRRQRPRVARARWRGRRRPIRDVGLDRAEVRGLVAYWRRIAQFEHASVVAFEELALRLGRVGAPARLVERSLHAAQQERDHTRRAVVLAERFAGQRLVLTGLRTNRSAGLGAGDMVALAVEALRDGALNEGYAAWQAAAQARVATDPQVVETLRIVAVEEQEHADLSRDILAWCLEHGDAEVRNAVVAAAAALPTLTGSTLLTGPVYEHFGAADPDHDRAGFASVQRQVLDDVELLLDKATLAQNVMRL